MAFCAKEIYLGPNTVDKRVNTEEWKTRCGENKGSWFIDAFHSPICLGNHVSVNVLGSAFMNDKTDLFLLVK